ncbi:hypothetical protein F5887DRAFT_948381 [Amanita rubescens]|nr:hypothetical protein F5887DRAFT_948381 [Amanita rubescens]
MLTSDFAISAMGGEDPYAPDSYKRAVYMAAPTRFTIEFLEPTKQGHSYSYGMRISAADRSDRMSTSTTMSLSDYTIWRRWEDCLWFQDALEQEYKRLAREKKQRLLRGKGVKKNGLYLQDRAASFESLPPGPHPDSVAQDVHQYLPRLTKKGTVFRASQALINQRNAELRALVEALYQEDLPALLHEIRESQVTTDFFGYWRRDFDLYENSHKRESTSSARSVISAYFTSSSASLFSREGSIRSGRDTSIISPRFRTRTTSDVSTHSGPLTTPDMLRSKYYPSRHQHDHSISSFFSRPSRPRAVSTASTDSSSSASDRSSDAGTLASVPGIVDEVPVTFGHNPQHQVETNPNERPHSLLEVLPEDGEIDVKADALAMMTSLAAKRRRKSSAANLQLNKQYHYQDYGSPPLSPTTSELETVLEQDQPEEELRCPPVRESWATTDSATTYLEGLKLSLPPQQNQDFNRTSVVTFMTTDSSEAIIRSRRLSRSLPASPITPSIPKSRLSQAVTLSDYEMWTDPEDENGSEIESALGTGKRDSFPRPISFCESLLDCRPEAPPLGYRDTPTPTSPCEVPLPSFFPPTPPSPTFSTASDPISMSELSMVSSIVPDGMISIKAALNQSIVALRVSRTISYGELRERLYDKFVIQEGLPLSKSFTIALTNPIRRRTSRGRSRSSSVSSVEHMEFISSQRNWDSVVTSYDGGKLTLRILETTT